MAEGNFTIATGATGLKVSHNNLKCILLSMNFEGVGRGDPSVERLPPTVKAKYIYITDTH